VKEYQLESRNNNGISKRVSNCFKGIS